MQERAFKGVWIPAEIWLNKDLSLLEKVFFVEIASLDNEDGCFASNSYFADFFGLSESRVKQVINSLCKKRYIESIVERSVVGVKRTIRAKYRFTMRPKEMGQKTVSGQTISCLRSDNFLSQVRQKTVSGQTENCPTIYNNNTSSNKEVNNTGNIEKTNKKENCSAVKTQQKLRLDECVSSVFDFYTSHLKKGSLCTLTDNKKKKIIARYKDAVKMEKERLKEKSPELNGAELTEKTHKGAIAMLKAAISATFKSDFHVKGGYTSLDKNIFNSVERFEGWLNKATTADFNPDNPALRVIKDGNTIYMTSDYDLHLKDGFTWDDAWRRDARMMIEDQKRREGANEARELAKNENAVDDIPF